MSKQAGGQESQSELSHTSRDTEHADQFRHEKFGGL